jgi:hypothetical protein
VVAALALTVLLHAGCSRPDGATGGPPASPAPLTAAPAVDAAAVTLAAAGGATSSTTQASGTGSTVPPAARPAPLASPPVELVEAVALVPGASTALLSTEVTTVDPNATFRVVLRGTAVDVRLVLLDSADAMASSAGARESGPRTTLTLQPATPLRPGTRYRLRVDGATAREVRLADGTTRAPVDLELLVAGELEPRPQKPGRAKRPPR